MCRDMCTQRTYPCSFRCWVMSSEDGVTTDRGSGTGGRVRSDHVVARSCEGRCRAHQYDQRVDQGGGRTRACRNPVEHQFARRRWIVDHHRRRHAEGDVRVPEGTDLVVGATSGRVTIEGRVGSVSAVTTSGRVSIADAGSVDVRTKSGRIDVGRTMSTCRAVASSAESRSAAAARPMSRPAVVGSC